MERLLYVGKSYAEPRWASMESRYPTKHRFSTAAFRRRCRAICIAASLACFLLYIYHVPHRLVRKQVYCPQNSLAKDVLLVMRTGATEVPTKLPIHFDTTLRCTPNYLIVSDYEEVYQGYQITNVLNESSTKLREHKDFIVYHQLQMGGRHQAIKGTTLGSGPAGSDVPAWKLDRFKFFPMVERAYRHNPFVKWYVFMEPDTSLFWTNLLGMLGNYDFMWPYYIGREMMIGDTVFAHGGGSFALSRPAVEQFIAYRRKHRDQLDEEIINNWAGDAVLGKALKDAKISLSGIHLNLHSDALSSIPFEPVHDGREPWCFASATYHHMTTDDIRRLWEFEQQWYKSTNKTLLHGDVFKSWILPQLGERVDDWDNVIEDSKAKSMENFEACHTACLVQETCQQFSYAAGNCSMSPTIRLGYKAPRRCLEYSFAASTCTTYVNETGRGTPDRIQSGWLRDRVQRTIIEKDEVCKKRHQGPWIQPEDD